MNLAAPALQTRGLTLHAAGRCLVRGLDWQVSVGQRWCVIGRNAAGKSTLLRALAGLDVPQCEGELLWFGQPQAAWPAQDAARVRAYVPQHSSDRFPIRVQRLLELTMQRPDADAVLPALAALDAQALAQRDALQLSGGERQRVALAQCQLQGAPLMLMDEPVSFQDPAHQMLVARWLHSLPHAAVVVTAHDVNWIARAATHVLVLHGDGLHEQGPVHEMLDAARLERAYGCRWVDAGGVWVAA